MAKLSWKEEMEKSFDRQYRHAKKQYPDAKFPCFGGMIYWWLLDPSFVEQLFCLTQSSLIYHNGGEITEIPFKEIRKLSIKRGLFKSSYHIRITADKRYHFIIKQLDYLSTRLAGNSSDNVMRFIDTLQSKVVKRKK